MSRDPIFIIGTERSGSNLLRLILNAHSNIAVPHPPHIVRYFAPLEPRYGDLKRGSNFRRLISDVLSLVEAHIHPWEITLDAERIFSEADPRDLFGIYFAVYGQYLRSTGKKRWGCKSTFMIRHVERALRTFPSAKFIWLVRDPRDVAASSIRSVFNPFHPYFTARLWNEQQAEGFRLLESLPEKNITLLKYEDLLANPEKTVRALCDFLDEPYEPEMLKYYAGAAAAKSSRLSESWKNAASPILSDNKNTYKKYLTRNDIAAVESAAGNLMRKLGYLLEFPEARPQAPSKAALSAFQVQDCLMSLKMEWHSLFHDKNHWLRWKRALLLRKIARTAKADG